MFLNKRLLYTNWRDDRDHKINDSIAKIATILEDMERFPQCRWIASCQLHCCMYQCHKCSVHAQLVIIIQDCYLKLKEIQTMKRE